MGCNLSGTASEFSPVSKKNFEAVFFIVKTAEDKILRTFKGGNENGHIHNKNKAV